MEKNEFLYEAKAFFERKAAENGYVCKFFEKGFTSTEILERILINQTNIKYFNSESDVLLGDFFILLENSPNPNMCRFEAEQMFREYEEGGWERIDEIIEDNFNEIRAFQDSEVLELLEGGKYEPLKNKLIIRPINFTDNKYALKDFIYRRVGDVALVLYVVVSDMREGESHLYNTIRLSRGCTEKWDITEEELWKNAMMNTNALYPPRIFTRPLDIYKAPYSRGTFMAWNSEVTELKPMDIPTLTTTSQMNGAIAIFYTGVMERIGQMFGDDYYVVFTSVHELRMHKKSVFSPINILHTLKDMNKMLMPDELLSRKVYLYERGTGELKQLEL